MLHDATTNNTTNTTTEAVPGVGGLGSWATAVHTHWAAHAPEALTAVGDPHTVFSELGVTAAVCVFTTCISNDLHPPTNPADVEPGSTTEVILASVLDDLLP